MIRHLGTSSLGSLTGDDTVEARRIIAQLVPYFVDRSGTTLHRTWNSALQHFRAGFELVSSFSGRPSLTIGTDAVLLQAELSDDFLAVILRDVAQLLRPQTVTVLSLDDDRGAEVEEGGYDYRAHAMLLAALALSDLSTLFEHPSNEKQQQQIQGSKRKSSSIRQKVVFHIAHVLAPPAGFLRSLAQELEAQSYSLERRRIDVTDDEGSIRIGHGTALEGNSTDFATKLHIAQGPKIKELS